MVEMKIGATNFGCCVAVLGLLLLPAGPLSGQTLPKQKEAPPAKQAPPTKEALPAQPAAKPAPKTASPTPSRVGFALPNSAPSGTAPAAHLAARPPVPVDRASAYYQLALASIDEEMASTTGRRESITHAIEEYKTALNADPESPELINALALFYFRAGRIADAIVTAKDAAKRFPQSVDAHRLLGKIYLRSLSEGQRRGGTETEAESAATAQALDLAIAEFQAILAIDPKSVEDHMILGQLYTAKHEKEKAEAEFKIAQGKEPDSESVVLNLARLYAESGDLKQAAAVVEAVPAASRTAQMEFALGATQEQLKHPKEAIATYRRAAALDADNLDVRRALAQALLGDGQLDEAQKAYEEIVQATPDDSSAWVKIAEIERRLGKYEMALVTVRKARKIDADSLEAGYNEGLLLDVLGRADEAVAVYEQIVDKNSHANGAYTTEERNNRAIFLERLGAVYHQQNKVEKAIETYQKLISMGGDTAINGYRSEVEVYTDAKQFDKAVEVAEKAVATDPKDRELKLALADALISAGRDDEALIEARVGLNKSDEDRATWLGIAQVYTRMRRWKDAEQAIAQAESLTRKKEEQIGLNFYKGVLAERQKHFEPAEQFFRLVLEQDPSNVATLNYLGYMLADKGTHLPEALKLVRKAVELEPLNGAYLDSLGWTYFKMGQYELAEENLHRAVTRDQTDPTVHDHMGDLYEKTGRIRLAAAEWEIALTEFSRSAKADVDPVDVARVRHKLEGVRTRLTKQDSATGEAKANN